MSGMDWGIVRSIFQFTWRMYKKKTNIEPFMLFSFKGCGKLLEIILRNRTGIVRIYQFVYITNVVKICILFTYEMNI